MLLKAWEHQICGLSHQCWAITSVCLHLSSLVPYYTAEETSVPKNGTAQSSLWLLGSVYVKGGELRLHDFRKKQKRHMINIYSY